MRYDAKSTIEKEAPDRDNREAMLLINRINDQFTNARHNLRRDDQTYMHDKPLNNPVIGLFPTKYNVWEDLAITYGGEKVCNYDGIPSWCTILDIMEKHLKTKIRYY